MLILGLLGMYFDAAVVCICHQPGAFIKIGCGHTVYENKSGTPVGMGTWELVY